MNEKFQPALQILAVAGNDYPLQYFSMDRGTWQVTVHGVTESDTTEGLTLSLYFLLLGV